MELIKYPTAEEVNKAMEQDEPMMAVIAFDGSHAIMSHLDEAVEHHILLMKNDRRGTDIDKYFRIIFDKSGADWTFECPQNYRDISDEKERWKSFYRDGMRAISDFLANRGYLTDIRRKSS